MNKVKQYIDKLVADTKNPISEVIDFDLNESMQNGGGPACLRLRVVMNEGEFGDINQNLIFDEELYEKLKTLIEENYPDELKAEDLLETSMQTKINTCFDKYEEIFKVKL